MPLPVAKPLEAPCMPRVATLENLDEILQDPRKRPFVIEVSVEVRFPLTYARRPFPADRPTFPHDRSNWMRKSEGRRRSCSS
jgi:hypothetical protein